MSSDDISRGSSMRGWHVHLLQAHGADSEYPEVHESMCNLG